MAFKDTRNGEFMLGWAMPVDYTVLGARLECWAATKPQISTLRCCVKHAAASQAISRLSFELMEMIARMIQDDDVESRFKQWQRARLCMEGGCSFSTHFSQSHLTRIRGQPLSDRLGLSTQRRQIHTRRVIDHECKLNDTYKGPFHRMQKQFAQKFGVEILFSLVRDAFRGQTRVFVKAYMVMPKQFIEIDPQPEGNLVSLQVEATISSEAVEPLTEKEKLTFRIAAQILGVRPKPSTPMPNDDWNPLDWMTDSESEESEADGEHPVISNPSSQSNALSDTQAPAQKSPQNRVKSVRNRKKKAARVALLDYSDQSLDDWPRRMLIGYSEKYMDYID